jgi:AAA domain, putative AbiEii toxin, Type IV TA system
VKFEFQNLGTIKKTTLDLRPLTVILGPNNTSKTYLAYCVHGLIKELRSQLALVDFFSGSSEVEIELHEVVIRLQEASRRLSKTFSRQLAEYFQDTYGGLFQEAALAIHIDERDVLGVVEGVDRLGGVPVAFRHEKLFIGRVPSVDPAAKREALRTVLPYLMKRLSGTPLTLPAERNAFVITYKMLSARRYRVLRDQARAFPRSIEDAADTRERQLLLFRGQGDVRYPEPIEDFLDFLTDVELDAVRTPRDDTSFATVARLIEQHIQGGHRTSYEATKLGGKDLTVTVDEHLRLDLYNASSSIKQIAPLLLYLRYRAASNQTLIIDEPEMNLHPEGQAKLLEALAMLANLGVRVLLTTHSPYFMAHLNNLIASDQASAARKKRQAQHLYMGDPAAFLSPDDVSAYEMRPEGLSSLSDAEYGIRWDTLSDVSAELQRRYFAIVEEPKRRAQAK